MLVNTLLIRLVVVGAHLQSAVYAHGCGSLGQLNGFCGAVGTRAGNNLAAPGYEFHAFADDFEVFFGAYGGRFAGGAHGHDAVYSAGNLGFNQCFVGIIIHLAVLERGNNSCIKSLVFHIIRGYSFADIVPVNA